MRDAESSDTVALVTAALSIARPRAPIADALLAAALLALAQEHVWSGAASGSKAVTASAALVATLVVAVRRRWPIAAMTTAMAAVAAQSLLASSPQANWLIATTVVLAYAVGAVPDLRRALLGAAVAAAGLAIDFATANDRGASGAVFVALIVALPWLAARAVHRHRRRAELLETRATELERQREAQSRQAVAAERARIARELHDMVAHAVSLVVVQAEAAEAVLDVDREQSQRQLQAIQRTGRQALAEMTRLLAMLRPDGDDPARIPQPSLERLDGLLAENRAAGLSVELTVEGEPLALPPGLDLAAYRIVQEALTNTRKHAAAAHANVLLRYGGEAIELLVSDDGRGVNGDDAGNGHGLIGMRERVHLYGGTLTTGTRPVGGYEVRARLPLDETQS